MKAAVLALLVLGSVGCYASDDGDDIAIENCISHWGKTPFKAHPKFRTISAKVKGMGIGGDVNENARPIPQFPRHRDGECMVVSDFNQRGE